MDLSLILVGDGVCGTRARDGLPLGVWGPLTRSSWITLLVSLRLAWWSTNHRLRSPIAAVSLPDSPVDLSERSLLCLRVFALNSCRDASWSLWKAANLFSTSALSISGESLSLPSSLSPSLLPSLSPSQSIPVTLSPSQSIPVTLSPLQSIPVTLSLSLDPLSEELRLVACLLLSVVWSTLLCFDKAIATRKAIRVAAAANKRKGDGPCCAPQSTLQRQGGGFIWAKAVPGCAGKNPVPGLPYCW